MIRERVLMRIGVCIGILCATGLSSLAKAHDLITLFSTNWSAGIDKRIQYQESTPESIELVDLDEGGIKKQ
jgi:hypothetical protein